MTEYFVKQTDQELLAATRKEWERQIQDGVLEAPSTHYLQTIAFAEQLLRGEQELSYSYSVVEFGSDYATALMDITHARPKSDKPWLKVLSIRVEPKLDSSNEGVELSTLSRIAATAIVESIGLTIDEHPSRQLKVYGESPLDRNFLTGVAANLPSMKELKVSAHGNWLVIDSAE